MTHISSKLVLTPDRPTELEEKAGGATKSLPERAIETPKKRQSASFLALPARDGDRIHLHDLQLQAIGMAIRILV